MAKTVCVSCTVLDTFEVDDTMSFGDIERYAKERLTEDGYNVDYFNDFEIEIIE